MPGDAETNGQQNGQRVRRQRDAAAGVRFDSNSAEAYTSLGFVRLFYDWTWTGAQAVAKAIVTRTQFP